MPSPIGTPTERAASSSSSRGTPGIVVMTIRVPSNHPPKPRTIGYSERSVALAFRPNGPRHRARSAINRSESTVRAADPSIAPRTIFAIAPWPKLGVKSTREGL